MTPLIITAAPVKDASHLDTHFALLDRLRYPRALISLAYLESDSSDGTFEALGARLEQAGRRYRRCRLLQQTWASISRRARRLGAPSAIAAARRAQLDRAIISCLGRSTTRTGCFGSTSMWSTQRADGL
jgi:hypothetical protein